MIATMCRGEIAEASRETSAGISEGASLPNLLTDASGFLGDRVSDSLWKVSQSIIENSTRAEAMSIW